MKKTFLIALIFTTGLFSVNAQSTSFGIKGGVNFASLKTEFITLNDKNIYLGLFAEFPVSEKFSIQPEASMFSIFGNYVNVPVKAKYNLNYKFSFLAGPSLGISLDSGSEFREGLTFGIESGIEYNISNKFLIEAKYNYGLTDIYVNSSSKQSGLFLGIGYRF